MLNSDAALPSLLDFIAAALYRCEQGRRWKCSTRERTLVIGPIVASAALRVGGWEVWKGFFFFFGHAQMQQGRHQTARVKTVAAT